MIVEEILKEKIELKPSQKSKDLIRLDPYWYNGGQLVFDLPEISPKTPVNKGALADSEVDNQDVHENVLFVHPFGNTNVINVDWFETSIFIPQNTSEKGYNRIQISENLWIINKGQRARRYDTTSRVIYMGEEVGTLWTNPFNRRLPSAIFKMENHLLYTPEWMETYLEILNESKWNHKNIVRFDICIDGIGAYNGLRLAKKHLNPRVTTLGRKGKAKLRPTFDTSTNITHLIVGSSKSDKVATFYNKSAELQQSEKDYIQKSWDLNGLEGDRVHRFEIRLKSALMKNYETDLQRLSDPKFLASIVMTECKNWFEFTSLSKDTKMRRKNKQATKWMDWDSIQGRLLPKHQAVTKSGIHRAKRWIKDTSYMLYMNEVHEDKIELFAEFIYKQMDEYNLFEWYKHRIDHWHSDWEREKKYKNINSN
jgi:hypothetical protein